jgi:hypothetical protein
MACFLPLVTGQVETPSRPAQLYIHCLRARFLVLLLAIPGASLEQYAQSTTVLNQERTLKQELSSKYDKEDQA